MRNTRLTDYADVEPLTVREIKPVHHWDGNCRNIVGFIGPSNRNANCIVCERKRHRFYNKQAGRHQQQYYRKGKGYAFSESTLDKLRSRSVIRIVIEEVDNDRVLEHDVRDFEQGEPVDEHADDIQRYVPVNEAIYEWRMEEVNFIKASKD